MTSAHANRELSCDHWLIVGLGNPGRKYDQNRHNIGFMVADALAATARLSWRQVSRLRGSIALGSLEQTRTALLKPDTYMNLSGESVVAAAHYYRIAPSCVIAVHDDLDLDLGRLKLKRGGGDGGHKGIRSMTQMLGTPGFVRVRVGIGRPRGHSNVTGHVLGNFDADDRTAVESAIDAAQTAIRLVITEGLTVAMNRCNRSLAE